MAGGSRGREADDHFGSCEGIVLYLMMMMVVVEVVEVVVVVVITMIDSTQHVPPPVYHTALDQHACRRSPR